MGNQKLYNQRQSVKRRESSGRSGLARMGKKIERDKNVDEEEEYGRFPETAYLEKVRK